MSIDICPLWDSKSLEDGVGRVGGVGRKGSSLAMQTSQVAHQLIKASFTQASVLRAPARLYQLITASTYSQCYLLFPVSSATGIYMCLCSHGPEDLVLDTTPHFNPDKPVRYGCHCTDKENEA